MTYTPHHPFEPVPDRSFTPVPVRPRHDGWSPGRQAEFIEALAACGCVIDAAARVGMSSDSAYDLRRREGAVSFRAAWDAALHYAVRRMSEAAFSRALHGVAVPHYYKGQLVGEHRRFDEGLTRFLLQHLDRSRYGPKAGGTAYNFDEKKVGNLADTVREVLAPSVDAGLAGSLDSGNPGDVPPDVSPGSPTSERWGR